MTSDSDRQHAEEVRVRLAAATPGPWEAWQNRDAELLVSEPGRGYMGLVAEPSHRPTDYGRANAELIAHAPADLGRLLIRAEKAEAALDRVASIAQSRRQQAEIVAALTMQTLGGQYQQRLRVRRYLDEAELIEAALADPLEAAS